MTSWSVLTSHARVLLCIARDPGVRLRDIAAGPGSTKRSAYGIVTDLTTAGYAAKQKDGRRNRYQRLQPRTPWRAVCLGWGGLSGGRRVSSPGESGCESGEEEDAGASGTLNRAACEPAWLAAADHRASPSSPGLACCQAASAHAPVTRAAGVPAAGCAGQPRPDG